MLSLHRPCFSNQAILIMCGYSLILENISTLAIYLLSSYEVVNEIDMIVFNQLLHQHLKDETVTGHAGIHEKHFLMLASSYCLS